MTNKGSIHVIGHRTDFDGIRVLKDHSQKLYPAKTDSTTLCSPPPGSQYNSIQPGLPMEQHVCINTVIHLMFRDFTFYFYCIKDSPLKRGNFLWKLEKEQDTFILKNMFQMKMKIKMKKLQLEYMAS